MKKTVKLFFVVIAFTMATDELIAQNFVVKGGLNLSNMRIKDNDETFSDETKMNLGYHIGATVEFPLSEIFSFETGLLVSAKGFKFSEEGTDFGGTYKRESEVNLLYMDIPVTAKTSFDLGNTKIYGVFGPYLGIGLSGKTKLELEYDGEVVSKEEDVRWGSDEEADLKKMDFGLTVGAGIELNSFQMGLTYSLGLANISPYSENGYKISNRVLGISIGYKIGGK